MGVVQRQYLQRTFHIIRSGQNYVSGTAPPAITGFVPEVVTGRLQWQNVMIQDGTGVPIVSVDALIYLPQYANVLPDDQLLDCGNGDRFRVTKAIPYRGPSKRAEIEVYAVRDSA